jgi:nucleoid-associated protein YgaU
MEMLDVHQLRRQCSEAGNDGHDETDRLEALRNTVRRLTEKYSDLLLLASRAGLEHATIADGRLRLSGRLEFQLDVDRLWDNIKTHTGWEHEIVADLRARRTDVLGVHVAVPGDTLAALALSYLGDAGRSIEIFRANTESLLDPDRIDVGQQLIIPAR